MNTHVNTRIDMQKSKSTESIGEDSNYLVPGLCSSLRYPNTFHLLSVCDKI